MNVSCEQNTFPLKTVLYSNETTNIYSVSWEYNTRYHSRMSKQFHFYGFTHFMMSFMSKSIVDAGSFILYAHIDNKSFICVDPLFDNSHEFVFNLYYIYLHLPIHSLSHFTWPYTYINFSFNFCFCSHSTSSCTFIRYTTKWRSLASCHWRST